METARISALMMAAMMYPTIMATAFLIVPSLTALHANQDMWLSPIWASITGFFTVYLVHRLHKLYPNQSIIQYSRQITGNWMGRLIGLLYLFYLYHTTGIILYEYATFVVGVFMPHTPLFFFISSLALICSFAVYGGVEVIGRVAQLFLPLIMIPLLIICVLGIPDYQLENMFPILEHGLVPSLKGSVVPQGWLSEMFLISFLLPFLTDQKKGLKWGAICVIAIVLTMLLSNLLVLFIYGQLTPGLIYPVLNASRYVSIADFLEHLESLVMALWIVGAFVKITVFYFACVMGTAQWFQLSDYRRLILPVWLWLTSFGMWAFQNFSHMVHYLGTTGTFHLSAFGTVIPLLLLILAFIRKKGEAKKGCS